MRLLRASLLLGLALVLSAPGIAAAKGKAPLWVSLGDSYATGYQPGAGDTNAYARAVTKLAAKRHRGIRAVQLGCAGEDTDSMKDGSRPCGSDKPPWAGRRSQVAHAERFLRANRERVRFVTVVIGGNDFTSCLGRPDVVECAFAGVRRTEANLPGILRRLRRAGGAKMRFVGFTYPNVALAWWDTDRGLAAASQTFFAAAFNPALRKAYAAQRMRFVDITKLSGTLDPLEGDRPVPVERVCALTWMCSKRDIHANDAGYRLIARHVTAAALAR